jgi:DNA-binding winged helix-turn-helix (wHTH) protein
MADFSKSDLFEFGGFRLDRRRRLLIAPDGEPASVNAKAFDVLAYFLQHPGQIIDRSTLLDTLWPDTVVEENNLSQAVVALRRVLGDGFIATVPSRGYQFVAEVRTVDEQVEGDIGEGHASARYPLDAREQIADGSAAPIPTVGGMQHEPRQTSTLLKILGARSAYLLAAAFVIVAVLSSRATLTTLRLAVRSADPRRVNRLEIVPA